MWELQETLAVSGLQWALAFSIHVFPLLAKASGVKPHSVAKEGEGQSADSEDWRVRCSQNVPPLAVQPEGGARG